MTAGIVISTGSAFVSGAPHFAPGASRTNAESVPTDRPLAVPASQVYFWTARWQREEAESLAEIERGESVTFEGPNRTMDLLHWLYGDD